MALIDLHVHTKYSKHPSQWFLQRVGTRESYTEVEDLYAIAKSRGMHYVTISDHNTIEGAVKLVEQHPQDTFVSVEATAYFPEDGCKVHILIYDIHERQFREIDRLRHDIYHLRDYVKQEQLAYSVAHATYNVNGRLTFEAIEKLMLLFDVFEEVNGGRNPKDNLLWGQALAHLTAQDIDQLHAKHRIEPFSDTPWVKGLTGGSDDHAGLFIGQCFTEADCATLPEFIERVKRKKTSGGGKSNNFKSLAFALYKIACDFSQDGRGQKQSGPMAIINNLLFENKKPGLRNRLAMRGMKFRKRKEEKTQIVIRFLEGVVTDFMNHSNLSINEKIDKLYENIATMTDEFFAMIFESLERDFKQGDMNGVIKSFSAILPAIFLSVPFFSTIKHLSHDRDLINRLRAEYVDAYQHSDKRVLWFSDTIREENAAARAVKEIARAALHDGRAVQIVASDAQAVATPDLPPNVLQLPAIYSYAPNFQRSYTMCVPSVLKSLEMIYQANPDMIVISTPGPLGVVGIIAAKLLGIPCIGMLHADYAEEIAAQTEDEQLFDPIDSCVRWVYSLVNTLYVPSVQDMRLLEERGYDAANMQALPQPAPSWSDLLTHLFGAKA